jgi:two-component system nitrogen regulation sensor histidine kinase NtrY
MSRSLQKAWKWSGSHESTIQLLAFLGGLPAAVIGLFFLWSGAVSIPARWTLSTLIIGAWLGCVLILRSRVIFPMQTLTNLLDAFREGDYSVRSCRGTQSDSLGEVMATVNQLGETLLQGRQEATEATALLQIVTAKIDVAVFVFDDKRQLRLINRAGTALLDQPAIELLHCHAKEIGLEDCLEGAETRTLLRLFPGSSGTRWGLRRTRFEEDGNWHELLVLTDLSRSLSEEDRAAWRCLIRVLGSKLNNSPPPILVAQNLRSILKQPEALRPADWRNDVENGLNVIEDRTEALDRFLDSYRRVARLPEPSLQPTALQDVIERAASLEKRTAIKIHPYPEGIILPLDPGQIEQALRNLIRNAVEAMAATGGSVHLSWVRHERFVEILVEDEGPGLADTANLFVPFFTTKPDGNGIGLLESREIAEAHGGSLILESRADGRRGCRAILRMPLPLTLRKPIIKI